MKVALLSDINSVKLISLKTPVPNENEILIKMTSCAICTWDQRAFSGINKVEFPFVGGHEMFGVIVKTGSNIDDNEWRAGDKVAVGLLSMCGSCHYCRIGEHGICSNHNYNKKVGGLPYAGTGGFSEYLAVSPDNLFKASNDIADEIGAFTEPLSCVIHSVEKINLEKAQNVLVIGAGTMGILHLLVLKNRGLRVIISEPDKRRRDFAHKLGADFVIDPGNDNPVERIKNLTDGRGADAVIDATALLEVAKQSIEMVAPLGTVSFYSSIYPKELIQIDPNWLHKKMVNITGSANSNSHDFQNAIDMLSEGIIDPSPLISRILPLEDIAEAFKESMKTDNYRTVLKF